MRVPWKRLALGALTAGTGCAIAWTANTTPDSFPIAGKSPRYWVKQLDDPDYRLRFDAADKLAAAGPDVIPDLINLLQDRESTLVTKLKAWGRQVSPEHFPHDERPKLRRLAAHQLTRMAEDAQPAIPYLIEALGDPHPPVREEAARTLRAVGAPAAERLIKASRDSDPDIRLAAVTLLSEGHASTSVRAALLAAFQDEEPAVVSVAAHGLAGLGFNDWEIVKDLSRLLRHEMPDVRVAAAEALGELGAPAIESVSMLAAKLRDHDGRVRIAAAIALWRIDRRDSLILPILIDDLYVDELRWEAALAIGQLGELAAPAVSALADAMQREEMHRPFRTPPVTAFALGRIGKPAVETLQQSLTSECDKLRIGSALALNAMGEPARAAIPQLIIALQDSLPEVRHASALALADLGEQDTAMVPVLTDMLTSEDDAVRSMAFRALRRVAPEVAWQLRDLE